MTSSTARSSGTATTLAAFGAALAFLVASHVAFEAVARFAETRLGAYLWKNQDHLRVMEPHLHVGQGAGRLSLFGPSEVREGVLPDELQNAVPGLRPYQNAQSLGTLEDTLFTLHYLERVHGRSALPAHLLLGITPRFVGNFRLDPSPLVEGLRKYSAFDVDVTTSPPTLAPRPFVDSLRGRLRLLALAPDRYRRGLAAVLLATIHPVAPAFAARFERRLLRPAKYLEGQWAPPDTMRRWLEEDGGWRLVFGWDPAQDRRRIADQVGRLMTFCAQHGIRLYVVNLPEWSTSRAHYAPGRYEAYLSAVRAPLGDTPFLDLRTFLRDDEFWDTAHPNWAGAIRLSREVNAFVSRAARAAAASED
jgi:hypothetical protein